MNLSIIINPEETVILRRKAIEAALLHLPSKYFLVSTCLALVSDEISLDWTTQVRETYNFLSENFVLVGETEVLRETEIYAVFTASSQKLFYCLHFMKYNLGRM